MKYKNKSHYQKLKKILNIIKDIKEDVYYFHDGNYVIRKHRLKEYFDTNNSTNCFKYLDKIDILARSRKDRRYWKIYKNQEKPFIRVLDLDQYIYPHIRLSEIADDTDRIELEWLCSE